MSHDASLARVARIVDLAQLVADMGRRILAELSAAPALDVPVREKRVADFEAKLTARAQRLADYLDATPSPRTRKHTKNSARTWPRPSVPSSTPAPKPGELRTWE